MNRHIVFALLLCCHQVAASVAHAEESRKRGLWYREFPVEREEEKKKDPIEYKNLSWEAIENMTYEEFTALYKNTKAIAVHYPTETNIKAYLTLTNYMRLKGVRFTRNTQTVCLQHPELCMGDNVTSVFSGRTALLNERNNEVREYIERNQNRYGILYLYRPDCPFCKVMSGVLDMFEKKFPGLEVKRSNVYEPEGYQIATSMNVEKVPFVAVLRYGSKDYGTVSSSGVTSSSELEKRIWQHMRLMAGESITDVQTYEFEEGSSQDPNVKLFNEIKIPKLKMEEKR